MSEEFVLSIPEELVDDLAQRAAEIVRRERRFLSKSALADHLGLQPRTIKTWRERGLPGRRVGREVMFDLSEVEQWIDGEGQ